jgi:hypothetical protein
MNNERRSPLYLLTGLVIGLVIGLVYSLALDPVRIMDAAPHSLAEEFKDRYRVLISLAYRADGDVGRAAGRLALLRDQDARALLAAQAQELMADGGVPREASALEALSEALENYAEPVVSTTQEETSGTGTPQAPVETIFIPTSTMNSGQAIRSPTANPTFSPTPVLTSTPRVSPIPSSLLGAAFSLQEMTEVCIPGSSQILLQVEVLDKNEVPVPGIQIQVTWDGGEDFFYTGLFPDRSPGYADFSMDADVIYALKAGELGQTIGNLRATDCETSEGGEYPGGWMLTFMEPEE